MPASTLRAALVSSGLITALLFPVSLHGETFTKLGGKLFDPIGVGIFDSQPVIIGRGYTDNEEAVLRWTRSGGTETIATGFSVQAMSDDGTTVIGRDFSTSFTNPELVRWTATGGASTITRVNDVWPAPDRISADGSTIVGRDPSGAYRWAEDKAYYNFGVVPGEGQPPGVPYFRISDVSGDGSVIVGANTSSLPATAGEAVRWTEETGIVGLGPDPSFGNAAGVSDDGTVIVGFTASDAESDSIHPFRWTVETGVVSLGLLPETGGASATAISGNGKLIAGTILSTGTFDEVTGVFVWTSEMGMRNLVELLTSEYGIGEQLDGWSLREVVGISGDGRYIVGHGVSPDGRPAPWLVDLGFTPVPEASTYGVCGAVGLLGFVCLRRRQRGKPANRPT